MGSLADQPASQPRPRARIAARVEELYASHAAPRPLGLPLASPRSQGGRGRRAADVPLGAARARERLLAARAGRVARDDRAQRVPRARARADARAAARRGRGAPRGADAHAAAVSRYELATLREALAELPGPQREAILLRELRGLSYDEVARALSVTTAAVESLIFRARRTLQVRLSEALAALSPVGVVQPLRDFAARLVGGGVAAPAAAKVAAMELGAAVLAGGAVVGPTRWGLGHVPRTVTHVARPPAAPSPFQEAAPKAHVTLRHRRRTRRRRLRLSRGRPDAKSAAGTHDRASGRPTTTSRPFEDRSSASGPTRPTGDAGRERQGTSDASVVSQTCDDRATLGPARPRARAASTRLPQRRPAPRPGRLTRSRPARRPVGGGYSAVRGAADDDSNSSTDGLRRPGPAGTWPLMPRSLRPERLELGLDSLPGVAATTQRKLAKLGLTTCATCSSTGRAATRRPRTR